MQPKAQGYLKREIFDRTILVTLFVGALGGLLFFCIGLPAPWLSGAIISIAAVSFLGVSLDNSTLFRNLAFVALGFSIGSNVSSDTLEAAVSWPISIIILLICLIATILVARTFLSRVLKWKRATSLFASIPGSMTPSLIYAAETDADIAQVVGTHLIRLGVIATLLPSLIVAFSDDGATRISSPADDPWLEISSIFIISLICGLGLSRTKIPAGALIGAMLPSLLIHGLGISNARLPPNLLVIANVLIGSYIGVRLAQARESINKSTIIGGLATLTIGLLISLGCALLAAEFVDIPAQQLFLAYAPGGMEVMIILAFSTGYDPAFIGIHQLIRFLMILPILNFLAKRYRSNI